MSPFRNNVTPKMILSNDFFFQAFQIYFYPILLVPYLKRILLMYILPLQIY
jgi:hypothetical protein